MDKRKPSSWETGIILVLALVLGGAILYFLSFITIGVFFYVTLTVVVMTLFGFLHYVLWGYSLSQEVAGEREEEEMRRRLEEENQDF